MSSLGRVVWHEGMHLSQHHFQAQSRYFEELVRFVATSLSNDAYGVAACEFDEEALRNDTVSLLHARGLMPDGLPFDFPVDPAPAPRAIRDLFSPTADRHLVLLGIPAFVEGRGNVSFEEGKQDGHRFTAVRRMAVDEAGGTDAREVAVARKNFRLLLDVEESEGLVTLPVARVRRGGSGNFVYDESFIPPSLRIGASSALMGLVDRLLTMLESRSAGLATERSGDDRSAIASHWLAHTLHQSLATFSHHRRLRHAHPAELYAEMIRLAGALCTFSMQAHPRDLPAYEHGRPWECFGELARQVGELLNVVAPSNSIRVPVRSVGESFYAATIADARAFAAAEWYLAVRSSIGPAAVAAAVPRLVSICSAKHIERLVREAMPGLTPTHVLSPPADVSPRQGTEYFAIPRGGPCWTSIVDTGEVGLYVPAAVGDPELEIVITLTG